MSLLRLNWLSQNPIQPNSGSTSFTAVRAHQKPIALIWTALAKYLDEIGFGSISTRLNKFPDFRPYQPDPRNRIEVEDAAVQETIRHFAALGFAIRDRQSENVGWDLEAVKGSEVILLEVKGLSGSSMNVELTPNEYFHMKSRCQNYAVCIVVNALEARPCLSVFRFAQNTGNWCTEDGRSLSVTECIGARLSAE